MQIHCQPRELTPAAYSKIRHKFGWLIGDPGVDLFRSWRRRIRKNGITAVIRSALARRACVDHDEQLH